MRLIPLILNSLRHYRSLHALVVAGVAIAVAVLAGALLVGESVRASLRALALGRLGVTELVLSSNAFFRDQLADELRGGEIAATSPVLAITGAVTHEESHRTAARVQIFGIDDRFLGFQGYPAGAPGAREAWVSPALAAELGAAAGDSLLLRIAKPTDIPLSTLQGRRDDASQRVRVSAARVLDRAALGAFSLIPAQGSTLSMFVPLARLQQDLDVEGRANAVLVRMASPSEDAQRDVDIVKRRISERARLEDLNLTVRISNDGTISVLENPAGLLPDAAWQPAAEAASGTGHPSVGALTHLANTIHARGREIPYSLITAIDLEAYERLTTNAAPTRPTIGAAAGPPSSIDPPIRLNEWAAEDLGVVPGDRVDVDYFIWSDEEGLQTRSATFTFAGVVPMAGAGGDRTLTPEYPGITDAGDVTSWDPPFPVDMQRVRKKDEDYWDKWRSAPKAFIPLDVGQRLWPSPFGRLSSLRTRAGSDWPSIRTLDVFATGLTVRHARAEALAAADGTTDFGEYFIYFSFFLVIAGLLLGGLFFALSVEQRAKELGLLLAVGYRTADLRRVLIGEAVVLVVAGSAIGTVGAVAYAALIMLGLRTWWVGAVNTTALELHVDPTALLAGVAGAAAAATVALWLSFRRVSRRSARTLLTAGLAPGGAPDVRGPQRPFDVAQGAPSIVERRGSLAGAPFSRAGRFAAAILRYSMAFAAALIVFAIADRMNQVAAFFGAGGLLLVAGCAAFMSWLQRAPIVRRPPALPALSERRRVEGSSVDHHQSSVDDDRASLVQERSTIGRTRDARPSIVRFGAAYARWRPTRSVLSAALIAFACFVIVAVAAFRREPSGISLAPSSGTGGFVLMAESVVPLMHNPNTPAGRDELSLSGYSELDETRIFRFRLRPGDEASCLTLYQPKNPRLVAPEAAFLTDKRFTFSASLADSAEERANPWLLLNRRFADGAVPAIADQTTLTYVFHLGVGDDFVFTPEGGSPITLRIVGTLADSLLQSELIIGEHDFIRFFPRHEGYRVWLIDAPEARAPALTNLLEDRLSDFGVDVIDTRARLASYHEVENTYLSTFQALGSLGLLLGTLGLAAVLARNVLERRRELGVLGAIGFTPRHLRTLVTAESLLLVLTGLVIGTIAALIAIAPALAERADALPIGSLATLLATVIGTGLLSSIAAVRVATSTPVVEALKNE
jgi:putative ABC transport system permease protein